MSTRPPVRFFAAMAAWSSLLACVLTWPMIKAPGLMALGNGQADGLKHLWTLWWMRASVLQEGRIPFHTDLVNFPKGMDLFPVEPLGGALAVVFSFVDLVTLANLLALGNIALTGLAGAWFGWMISQTRSGAFVAGTLLEGSAVMAFFVHVGVGEIQHLWWIPIGLGTLLTARRSWRWAHFLALAGVLAAAVLSGFYIGLFLAVGTAIWALVTLGHPRDWPALLPRYAVAAGLALALVLPITATFATSYQSVDQPRGPAISWVFGQQGQAVVDPPSARLEPAEIILPPPPAPTPAEAAYGGGRYLGSTALLLALIGLVRKPRQALPWLAVAAAGYVLAMGSYLTVDGAAWTSSSGTVLAMPGLYLNRTLALIAEPINFPVRFLALTTVGLAGAASLGVRGSGAALAVVAVVEVAALQLVPWPWDRFELEPMDELTELADQYPGEGVVDLDFMFRPDFNVRRSSLTAQIRLNHPLNIMPVERIEYFAREGRWLVEALPTYQALNLSAHNQPGAISDEEAAATRLLLRDHNLRLFLVHAANNGRQDTAKLLTGMFGDPVKRGPAATVWRVPDALPDEEVDPTWRALHRAQYEARKREAQPLGAPLR